MKKMMIALGLSLLIVGSVYTVYSYNKSNQDNISNTTANSTNNTAISEQKNINNGSNNQTVIKNIKIKATDFKLKDLNGKEVSLSDFKGKEVFLNFWASWCPPCKAEMPEMQKLYEETKDSDLVMLTVNLSEDKSTVQKFIDTNKYSFLVLLDTDNIVASKYQIVSIPTSFFIDNEGNIVNKHIGQMTIENMKSYINNIK
jgi:peroxiredoxin